MLAQALDSIHGELACEQSRGLFLHHAGLPVLLTLLRGGRGGPHAPVDILLLLASPSRKYQDRGGAWTPPLLR